MDRAEEYLIDLAAAKLEGKTELQMLVERLNKAKKEYDIAIRDISNSTVRYEFWLRLRDAQDDLNRHYGWQLKKIKDVLNSDEFSFCDLSEKVTDKLCCGAETLFDAFMAVINETKLGGQCGNSTDSLGV
jgi:hypothetical protein